jgi:hypothetical protein
MLLLLLLLLPPLLLHIKAATAASAHSSSARRPFSDLNGRSPPLPMSNSPTVCKFKVSQIQTVAT